MGHEETPDLLKAHVDVFPDALQVLVLTLCENLFQVVIHRTCGRGGGEGENGVKRGVKRGTLMSLPQRVFSSVASQSLSLSLSLLSLSFSPVKSSTPLSSSMSCQSRTRNSNR